MRRLLRTALAVALVPPVATVAAHQAFSAAPYSAVPRPVTIAAYEHVGGAAFFGVEGLLVFPALAALLGLVVWLWTHGSGGVRGLGRADLVAFALLAGGGVTNLTESLLRGSVLDWLWLSTDGVHAIAMNAADAALLSGGLLLVGLALARTRASITKAVSHLRR
jgi:lipoprotein signal peptidase